MIFLGWKHYRICATWLREQKRGGKPWEQWAPVAPGDKDIHVELQRSDRRATETRTICMEREEICQIWQEQIRHREPRFGVIADLDRNRHVRRLGDSPVGCADCAMLAQTLVRVQRTRWGERRETTIPNLTALTETSSPETSPHGNEPSCAYRGTCTLYKENVNLKNKCLHYFQDKIIHGVDM